MNIAANLDHAAFHFPDHPAIIEGDGSASFSEFNRDANQIASALVSVGVQPGDHVALCAPNSYAHLAEKGTSQLKTVDRHRRDTAAILYTGGTTGIPKGAMLTHENPQTPTFNVAYVERSTQNDRARGKAIK